LTLAAAQPATAPGRSSAPGVRVIGLQPLAVQGVRFRRGERVTVVLFLDGRHTRTVRAGRNGSFVARFEEYANLCMAYTLRVMHGSTVRAAARHRPPPSCAALDPVP
jgi:hypothetical protein